MADGGHGGGSVAIGYVVAYCCVVVVLLFLHVGLYVVNNELLHSITRVPNVGADTHASDGKFY